MKILYKINPKNIKIVLISIVFPIIGYNLNIFLIRIYLEKSITLLI